MEEQKTLLQTRLISVLGSSETIQVSPVGEVTGDQLGRYPVVGQLGAGGMGTVLSVRDADLGRQVALKALSADASADLVRRFVQEAQVTGQLEHPNIVPIHELGAAADGSLFFTMKQVDGQDLAALLDDLEAGKQALSLTDRLRIFARACDAMAFAHDRGVIHRDLKPANIMVGRFGEVLVMDWGLAAPVGVRGQAGGDGLAEPELGQTMAGTILGTPGYMPPEQARGEVQALDGRADVYALGAILYELLTFEPPYTGDTAQAVLAETVSGRLIPPRERAPERQIPWELEAVVLKAMAADREERYRTVAEMQADVRAYLDGRLLDAASYSPLQRAGKWVGRHRTVSACLAVLLTVGGVAGWWVYRTDRLKREREVARLVDAARAALEGTATSEALRERRWSAGQMGERDALLERLLKAVSALEQALALARERTDLRALRVEAGQKLGWVALGGRDYSLARRAFADLGHHDVRPDRIRGWLEQVRQARTAVSTRRRQKLEAMLADIRGGLGRTGRPPAAPTLTDYVLEASGYRDRQTVEILGQVLHGFAARARERRRAGEVRWWQADRDLAIFCCRVLGRLGREDAVDPLGHWMAVVADPQLAIEAGLALCNTQSPRAYRPLMKAFERFGSASGVWARVKRRAALVPEPSDLGELASPSRAASRSAMLAAQGQPQRALEVVTAALKQRRLPGLLNNRGLTLLKLDRPQEALADLSAAVTLQPRKAIYWSNRAYAMIKLRRYPEAEKDATRAIQLDGRLAVAWYNRGLARYNMERFRPAIADYTRCIELEPSYQDAYQARGVARRRIGNLDGAWDDFQRGIRGTRKTAQAYSQRGLMFFLKGQVDRALADLDRAMALDPRLVSVYVNRSRVRLAAGRHREAEKDARTAIGLDPRSTEAHNNLGIALLRQGKLKEALAAYDASIKLSPWSGGTYANRAILKKRLKDLDGALADADKAVELSPRTATVFSNRGLIRLARKELKGAEADYSRAIALGSREPEHFNMRGLIRGKLGDPLGALADYRRALVRDPKYWRAWGNRGGLLVNLGMREQGRRVLTRAMRLSPPPERAMLQRILGQIGGPLEPGQLGPGKERYTLKELAQMASYAQARKNWLGSKAVWDAALKVAPGDARIWLNRGTSQGLLGQHEQALADFRKATELAPKEWRAWLSVGQAQLQLERKGAAKQALTRARALAPAQAWPAIDRLLDQTR